MTPSRRAAHDQADLQPDAKYQALLFDWDGTLADSQRANYRALAGALGQHDLPLDWSWYQTQTGISGIELITNVAANHDRTVDVEAIARDCFLRLQARLTDIVLVEHIADILHEHEGDRLLALGTGGPADAVLPALAALELASKFNAIVTLGDVGRGKPHPDIFLKVAQDLGVSPNTILVYEDTDEGLSAAQAAGMDAIDVRPIRMATLGY